MQRIAFQLRVRAGKTDEYDEIHREVWPELLLASDFVLVFAFLPADEELGLSSSSSRDEVPATLPRELRRNVKPGARVGVQDTKAGPLTIEEIVNSPIVSASNRKESALAAPAFVVVLTQKALRDRGYTGLFHRTVLQADEGVDLDFLGPAK